MRRHLLEDTQKWDEGLPEDLEVAVKAIRRSFGRSHWKLSHLTQTICYALLHEEKLDPLHEWMHPLNQVKAIVGPSALLRFQSYLQTATPPANVKAFFELYLDAIATEVVRYHADLSAIGEANEVRLQTPHIEWAEFQTKQLIRSQAHNIAIWFRRVCDKQTYDRNEDIEEVIYWRNWQAPKLLTMKPLLGGHYDPPTTWERINSERSLALLDHLTEHYVLRFDSWVRDRKGKQLVEAAKRARTTLPAVMAEAAPAASPIEAVAAPSNRSNSGPKKKATQVLHTRWQKAYKRSKKIRPEMSDVWHAQRIAESVDGNGASPETIRKNMK